MKTLLRTIQWLLWIAILTTSLSAQTRQVFDDDDDNILSSPVAWRNEKGDDDEDEVQGYNYYDRRYRGCLYRQWYDKDEFGNEFRYQTFKRVGENDDGDVWEDIGGDNRLAERVAANGALADSGAATVPGLTPEGTAPQATLTLDTTLYLLDTLGNERMVVVDPDTQELVKITNLPAGRTFGMVSKPDIPLIYVLHGKEPGFGDAIPPSPASISVFDKHTLVIADTFPLPEEVRPEPGRQLIDMSTDRERLYVTSMGEPISNEGAAIFVVDPSNGAVLDTIPIPIEGRGFRGVVVSPDGSQVYAYTNFGEIILVDTLTGVAGPSVRATSGIVQLLFHPNGTRAYIASQGSRIVVFDTTTFSVLEQIEPIPGTFLNLRQITLTPDGQDLFALSDSGGALVHIRTATLDVAQVFDVGVVQSILADAQFRPW